MTGWTYQLGLRLQIKGGLPGLMPTSRQAALIPEDGRAIAELLAVAREQE
ncbi:hypothetical protein [Pseudoduganella sp. HUAS MS19]